MSNFTKERRKIPKIKNYCFLVGLGLAKTNGGFLLPANS
jgi:hypothetical protein